MITNAFSVAGMKNLNGQIIKLDDGVMEFLFIKYPRNFFELQTIIGLLLSDKVDERYMYYGQFKTMEIESDPIDWSIDGESGGVHRHVYIEIIPHAIEIIKNLT